MIGKRNLGKAVVLGLLLSTGMYGAALAADIEMGGKLWNEAWNPNYTEIEAGDNLLVTTSGIGIGPNGTVNVIDGNLTVNSGSNSIQSGYSENATVQIFANNVNLTAGTNGIFTTDNNSENKYASTVLIGSEDRKIHGLTIEAGGQGIDNKNGNVYIYGTDDSKFSIHSSNTSGPNINQAAINNGEYEKGGEIILTGGSISLATETVDRWYEPIPGWGKNAIHTGDGITNSNGTTILNFNDVKMNVTGSGIRNTGSGTVSLNTKGSNTIFARYNGTTKPYGYYGVYSSGNGGTVNVIASETYDPDKGYSTLKGQAGYDNIIYGQRGGIGSTAASIKNVVADNNNYIGGGNAVNSESSHRTNNDVINIVAGNNNFIGGDYVNKEDGTTYTTGTGIRLQQVQNVDVNIESIRGTTTIDADGNGISINGDGKNIEVSVKAGTDIRINSGNAGITVGNYGKDITNDDTKVELIAAGDNIITVNTDNNDFGHGIHNAQGTVQLDAINNTVALLKGRKSNEEGAIRTLEGGNVLLEADNTNRILANSTEMTTLAEAGDFGDKYAINADREGIVDIKADVANTIIGAVYAKDTATNVRIQSLNENATAANYIGSSTVIFRAGDLHLSKDETMKNLKVVSSLYAQGGAEINLSGNNTIRTYANKEDGTTAERSIWAYDKGKINVDGYTDIRTNQYDESPNSMDVAVAAGTATNLDTDDFTNYPVDDDSLAKVTINYANANGVKSYIEGDVLAAYGGVVTIQAQEGVTRAVNTAGIDISGNLLAGNKGVLNVELGNGGTLTGRADDYGDAGVIESSHGNGEESGFFNPAFSSKILTGGEVNLTMGEGSKWTVTGQSWVTKVDTGNSEHVEIDLVSANSNLNEKAQALTIGEMNGNAMFTMQLDGKRSVSDMLYMKKAKGEYFINLKNAVTVEDMYQDGFDGLRFATVGKESHATFSAGTYDNGVYNVEYEVGTDDYDGNEENSAYNSTSGKGEMDEAKPGNDLVDNLFKEGSTATNGVMTLAAVASPDSTDATDSTDETENMGTNTDMNGKVLNDKTNFKLIGVKSTELSDAGKTVVAMSKVNYANAIYMDRLNKRMGEARYIDGDEGLWVRIRHDRIGKSDAFRSKNTMMELGYDKRVDDREDGEHRRGFAIDYMRGTTDYHNVAGDGDVRRGGLWLYDTWLGDKGHYSDYVLKIGRLSNDFEVYARSTGEKITGDYSNFVYSASAEYGRKKDIGKDWYFEPQVQLQYAHVTDADYTTSQGTSVELDAIDSLIGRVGFRLGKDMGENNTFYVKADVLHEFLGDQDISAFDDTGRLDTTYENEGTWYDVGLGFSHQFSKGTYMFLDVEKTFGNDNEDTYQFNVGMNWKV